MSSDDKPYGRTKAESVLTSVPALAAIFAGAFYFIGWQYKQSLAVIFGLANYPGDLSFQGTVAAGVAVFDSKLLPFIAIGLIGIYLALLLVSGLPKLINSWLKSVKLKLDTAMSNAKSLRTQLESAGAVDEDFLKETEKSTDNLLKETRRLEILSRISDYSNVLAAILISFIATTTIVILFYAGHLVAKIDAKAISSQVEEGCRGCFVYKLRGREITGVPVFQSVDAIYVQTKGQLVQIKLTKVLGINVHRQAETNNLQLPRR